MKTDEELFLDYQSGESTAMEELFQRHKSPIFNYALRLLRVRADAEDVVSEIFLVLFSRKYTVLPKAKFTTWLYTVARNACISRVRTRKKWFSLWRRKNQDNEFELWDIPDDRPHADQEAQAKEIAWHVQRAVAKLPLEQKEALILREYQALSYGQIAMVLNLSLEKVKITIFRARERLRKELEPFIKEADDD